MLRLLAAAIFLSLTPWAWAECTLDIETSTIDFGQREFFTGPHEIPVALTVTCPAGNNWRVRTNNNSVALPMVNNGSNNGYSYLLLRRDDGVFMRTTSNYIEGVGTGGPQPITIYAVLAGDSAGSSVLQKQGIFNLTASLLVLRNNTTGYQINALAQRVEGSVTGSCSMTSGGDMDFGTREMSAAGVVYEEITQITINCTAGMQYRLYPDHPTNSTNVWGTSSIRPLPSGSTSFQIYFDAREPGGIFKRITPTMFQTYTGTGAPQVFDFKATLSLEPKALGEFSVVVRPTITF